MQFVALFYAVVLYGSTFAKLVNTTIDDTYGDPVTGAHVTYAPAVAWNEGQSCTGCTAKINASQAYNSTWHDGTFALSNATNPTPGAILSASVPFTGNAVYVYCIIGHTFTSPNANSDMTFLLDGQTVGNFTLAPTGNSNLDYNVPVYVNTSIPHGAHTLSIESGHLGNKSLVLLDYIIYSHDVRDQQPDQTPGQTSSSSSSKTPIIIGAIVGPLLLVFAILAAVFFTRRYMRRKHGGPYPLDLREQFPLQKPPSFSTGPADQPWQADPSHTGSADPLYTDQAYDEPPTYAASTWNQGGSSAVPQSSAGASSAIHTATHEKTSAVRLQV